MPRTVLALSAVSLLNDTASEMVYPLLPAFLSTSLGAGPLVVGLLDRLPDLVTSAIRWWSGRQADRPGWRRPLVGIGYTVAIGLRPVMGLSSAAWQVIGIRILDRVGKGLRSPPRDAMIADSTPDAAHARAFAIHRGADHFGAAFGSLAAFLLLTAKVTVPTVLLLSAVPGVLALGALGAALVWTKREGGDQSHAAAKNSDEPIVASVKWLALVSAARIPEALLLLRLQDLGVAIALIPLLWGVLHGLKSAAAYLAGPVIDRIGAGAALGVGAAVYGVTVLALAGNLTPTVGMAGFAALGIGGGMLEPAERTLIAGLSRGRRGRGFGTYDSIAGFGALATGLIYGWLYQRQGGSLALSLAAATATIAAVAWVVIVGRRAPNLRSPL